MPLRNYHEILREDLQSRYFAANGTAFVVCYFVAWLFGSGNVIWRLFPWSWTLLRALNVAIGTTFPIFVLRKSNLHVGSYPCSNLWTYLVRQFFSFSALSTVMTYTVSAWLIMGVYLRNADQSAELGWTTSPTGYELPRINERYIYMFTVSTLAGIVSSVIHLLVDRDRIRFPAVRTGGGPTTNCIVQGVLKAAILSFGVALIAPIVHALVRVYEWPLIIKAARLFYKLPRSTALPTYPVTLGLLFRSFDVIFVTVALWETAHVLFSIAMSQAGSKEGVPLSQKSLNPNGTLVTGLSSARLHTQILAFEELLQIAYHDRARRASIFRDIEVKPNPWEQIVKQSLQTLVRVTESLPPHFVQGSKQVSSTGSAPAPVIHTQQESAIASSPPHIPVRNDNIFVTGPQKRNILDRFKSEGSAAAAMKLPDQLVTKSAQVLRPAQSSVETALSSRFGGFYKSTVGALFRQTLQLQVRSLIPEPRLQVLAVLALSRLIVVSVQEDTLGLVQRDIRLVVEAFSSTMSALEAFCKMPELPANDTQSTARPYAVLLPEIDIILRALHSGLADIVLVFAEYMGQMGLSSEAALRCENIANHRI
ncbi:hypothetical protein SAICODRAFT_70428 [Saitoella complicata NRRL Y-17804]|nr:uncharacterized protein SAICODRAFT_70428 [Saitoella complicata NRRL Y-17804]ODQ54211.1 hypothetical protein SAICODRAFT_70428 [Saitoella complicata NRRL Y-17804]